MQIKKESGLRLIPFGLSVDMYEPYEFVYSLQLLICQQVE